MSKSIIRLVALNLMLLMVLAMPMTIAGDAIRVDFEPAAAGPNNSKISYLSEASGYYTVTVASGNELTAFYEVGGYTVPAVAKNIEMDSANLTGNTYSSGTFYFEKGIRYTLKIDGAAYSVKPSAYNGTYIPPVNGYYTVTVADAGGSAVTDCASGINLTPVATNIEIPMRSAVQRSPLLRSILRAERVMTSIQMEQNTWYAAPSMLIKQVSAATIPLLCQPQVLLRCMRRVRTKNWSLW